MQNNEVALVTTTSYPNWYPGKPENKHPIDKIRGDLAIKMVQKAVWLGFRVVVTDGGSSSEFIERVKEVKIQQLFTKFNGTFSAGRRKSYRVAAKRAGVKAIVWCEPEKANLINSSLVKACEEIVSGRADIVVPGRDKGAFSSLPPYQEKSETAGNKEIQTILEKYLGHKFPWLDFFFGPKIFANRPEILNLFMAKFGYKAGVAAEEITPLEEWSNALTFPVVVAVVKGYKVAGFTINYTHPPEQTKLETDNPSFNQKRDLQRQSLTVGIKQLLTFYSDPEKSPIWLK